MKFNNLKSRAITAVLVGLPAVSAFAQSAGSETFDASAYAAKITGAIAGILVVGGAVFGLHVAIKSTKWARRAL